LWTLLWRCGVVHSLTPAIFFKVVMFGNEFFQFFFVRYLSSPLPHWIGTKLYYLNSSFRWLFCSFFNSRLTDTCRTFWVAMLQILVWTQSCALSQFLAITFCLCS
jgi:hypothetical protein